MSRPSRSARLVASGLTALLALTMLVTGASTAQAATCPDFVFVGARGSGETGDYGAALQGLGPTVFLLYDALHSRVVAAGKSMDLEVVHYPAVAVDGINGILKALHFGKAYDDSVKSGVADAQSRISAKLSSLPVGCSTRLVISGYSQGAQVVGEVMTALPDATKARIVGSALFGDPYFNGDDSVADFSDYDPNHHGSLSQRALWGNTTSQDVASYCHNGDPICNLSKKLVSLFGQTLFVRDVKHIYDVTHSRGEGIFDEHTNYPSRGDVSDGADHLAALMDLGAPPAPDAPTDVVFVIDSTGSMSGTIASVETNVVSLVQTIAAHSSNYRFALVDYKDDPGNDSPYQSRVDVPFTTDTAAFSTGVQSITASGGGDTPESVYSGVMSALQLPWRAGVKKSVIVIGDAPGKDPEPVTGYTLSTVVTKAFAVDPAQVYSVPVTTDPSATSFMKAISDGTGGTVTDGSDPATFVSQLEKALTQAGVAPSASVTTDSTAVAGQSVAISARGTKATAADPVVAYDWNFGEGTPAGSYDTTSPSAVLTHGFARPGSYTIAVRARTRSGLAGLATTSIDVTSAPSTQPGPPTTLAGTVTAGTAVLTWGAPTSGGAVDYYAVKDGAGAVIDAFTPSPDAVQEWHEPDFAPGASKTYSVYAVNAAGISAAAGPVTVSDVAVPTTTPDEFTGTTGTTLQVPAPGVLAGDAAADPSSALTARLATPPTHGSVSLQADGSFTYTPAAGFVGDDVFRYVAVDPQGRTSTQTPVTLHIVPADPAHQRFFFGATGRGEVEIEGRVTSGGFTWQMENGVPVAVGGTATVTDGRRHTWSLTISASRSATATQATVTISGPKVPRRTYVGNGALRLLGTTGIGGSFSTSTTPALRFGFLIKSKTHR